jgi:hypothetical protein
MSGYSVYKRFRRRVLSKQIRRNVRMTHEIAIYKKVVLSYWSYRNYLLIGQRKNMVLFRPKEFNIKRQLHPQKLTNMVFNRLFLRKL